MLIAAGGCAGAGSDGIAGYCVGIGRSPGHGGARLTGRGMVHGSNRHGVRSHSRQGNHSVAKSGRKPVASGRRVHDRGRHHRHHRPGYIPVDEALVPLEPGYIDGDEAEGRGMQEADDEGGVLLRAVTRGAAAEQAGLRAGDVILSFDGVRTRTFEELQDAVQQADGPVKVVFINGENSETEYLTVEPEEGRIGVTCE